MSDPGATSFDSLLAKLMCAIDAGETIDVEAFIHEHPEFTHELREYFAAEALVESLAGPKLGSLRDISELDNDLRLHEPPQDAVWTQLSRMRNPASVSTTTSTTTSKCTSETVPTIHGAQTEPIDEEFLSLGRYTIRRLLGEGAMGKVYLAYDNELCRSIALKVPKLPTRNDAGWEDRCRREAQAAAALRSPHICPVYDIARIDGRVVITMPYIEGESLAQRLDRFDNRRIPVADAVLIICKLAKALQIAHQQGIVHRDLKPSNVMIDTEGEPIILDFGLARDSRNVDVDENTLVGSPLYMSPEQVTGDTRLIGPATDIYGLGIVLFELLTGRTPFVGKTLDVLTQILNSEPVAPSTIVPGLDAGLEAICVRMLARSPSDRFDDMQDVANHLAAFTSTTAPTRAARMHPRRFRRFRLPVTMLVIVALSLISWLVWIRSLQATMQLNVQDPSLQVTFDERPVSRRADRPHRVRSGKHRLVVRRGEQELSSTIIIVNAGDDLHLKIEFERGQLVISQDGKPIGGSPVVLAEKELKRLAGTGQALHSLSASPSSSQILVGDGEGALQCWDVDKSELLWQTPAHHGTIECTVISSDGSFGLSGGSDHQISQWKMATGKLVRQYVGHTNLVADLALSSQNDAFCSASFDCSIRRWSVDESNSVGLLTYELDSSIPDVRSLDDLNSLEAHITWVRAVAYMPNDRAIVSGGNEALLAVWDADSNMVRQRLIGHRGPVLDVAVSPDGMSIVSASYDTTLRVWDAESGQSRLALTEHSAPVLTVDIDDSGQWAASGSADETVRVWQLASGRCAQVYAGHTGAVTGVELDVAHGRLISVGEDGTIRIWSCDSADLEASLH